MINNLKIKFNNFLCPEFKADNNCKFSELGIISDKVQIVILKYIFNRMDILNNNYLILNVDDIKNNVYNILQLKKPISEKEFGGIVIKNIIAELKKLKYNASVDVNNKLIIFKEVK